MAVSARRKTLAVAIALLTASCSFIYGKLKAENCSTDADCTARDPVAFAGYRCDPADLICKRLGPDGSGNETSVPECTTNAACQAELGNEKAICATASPRTCQLLETNGCVVLPTEKNGTSPVYKNENGLFFAMVEDGTNEGDLQRFDVAAMALNEINDVAGGLRPLTGGNGAPIPLGLLKCVYDANNIAGIMTHVKQLGIKAVIGPGVSSEFVSVARDYAIPNDSLFLMGSTPGSPSIAQLNDPNNLVWDVSPSQTVETPALQALAAAAEGKVRAEQSLASTTDIKVVIAYEKGEFGEFLLSSFRSGFKFNMGRSGPTDAANYSEFSFESNPAPTTYGPLVDTGIVSKAPSVVILLGNPGAVTIAQLIEQRWPTTDGGPSTRPQYVLNGYTTDDNSFPPQFNTAAASARVRGVLNPFRGPAFDDFYTRYNTRFGKPPLEEFATVYDAAYLLAYGTQAAQATGKIESPTRIAVASAQIGQEPSSPGVVKSLAVGPGGDGSNITTSLALLSGNPSQLDIVGASSQLTFDKSGQPDPRFVPNLEWCLNASHHFVLSGRSFDYATSTFVGTATTCF